MRQNGSDAAAGTSAGAAWRTIGKALGVAGIASGDTVYVGPGVYREAVIFVTDAATAETKVTADLTGEFTTDAPGEVVWTSYTNTAGDFGTSPGTTCLTISGKNWLTFEGFTFRGGGNPAAVSMTSNPTHTTFKNCTFQPYANNALVNISNATGGGAAMTHLFENCRFVGGSSGANSGALTVTLLTLASGADYDADITIRGCLFVGGAGVFVTNSGTATFKGGGVRLYGCTYLGGAHMLGTAATNVSTTIPCEARNCLILTAGTALIANTAGQITPAACRIHAGTAGTNITFDSASRTSTDWAPLLYLGQEIVRGLPPAPFATPHELGPLVGFGHDATGSPTTDLLGRVRSSTQYVRLDGGTATSGAAGTITDTNKAWGTDQFLGRLVRIVSGTGSGQQKLVKSNTATALTVGGNWATNPDNTSVYEIYAGAPCVTGKATAGSTTTLTDSNASFPNYAGWTLKTTGGTGSGQTSTITSNTATVITVPSHTATDSTTTYEIYRDTSISTPVKAAGALEAHDMAVLDAGGDSGSCIVLYGPADVELPIPVDATATVVSFRAKYDSSHGSTNKPQLTLVAAGELGVATETKTMTAAVDTWETVSFSSFSPTAAGGVRVRLISRADKPWGRAYFDTCSVS